MTALNSKWKNEKISRRRPRSVDDREVGHFTFLATLRMYDGDGDGDGEDDSW